MFTLEPNFWLEASRSTLSLGSGNGSKLLVLIIVSALNLEISVLKIISN